MLHIIRVCFAYFVTLVGLVVFSAMDVRGQGMYGPLNLYSDIYWGTDGIVYANSQVTSSAYHYSHRYQATARITAPNGSLVTNTSPWSPNSASTLATFDFGSVYLDGLFSNDSSGVGWCGIVAAVFATVYQQRQKEIPAWVKLGSFGEFNPTAINGNQPGGNSTTITIPYTPSLNAAGKTFTVSFGMGLTGQLIAGDVTGSGSGIVTVPGSGTAYSLPVTYTTTQTARSGTVRAAVYAESGSATVLQPTYVESATTANVNGG
jgi:hypothetical protein